MLILICEHKKTPQVIPKGFSYLADLVCETTAL